MKRIPPEIITEFSSLCAELRFNLARDQVSSDDLFDPNNPSNVYTLQDVAALLVNLRVDISKTLAAIMFGAIADTLSSSYFRAKATAADLVAFDSDLSLIRRRLHPQRIADRAPGKLWDKKFKLAAREIGMVNLTSVIDSSVPTERRTFLQVDLPNELIATTGILCLKANIASTSDFLANAMAAYNEFLDDTAEFQKGAPDGAQLQSRRSDGTILVIVRESFLKPPTEDSDTSRIVFPSFAKDERIGKLKLAANTDDLGELVFQAISFYCFLIEEELADNSLELLHTNGGVQPVRVIKPKTDALVDPMANCLS